MTWARFKRLFIILLGPLLIAGGVLAFSINQDAGYLFLRCQTSPFGSAEVCRSTGWGDFDERVAEQAPAWFDVNARPYEDNSFPKVYVSASQRQINGVEIIEVSPYFGTPDGPGSTLSQMRSLAGQKTDIIFGVPGESPKALNPLGCNELDFERASSGIFIAGLCGLPEGVVRVKFSVGQEGEQQLIALKTAIDNETSKGRRVMIQNYLVLTPIFVALFLVISGFVWIIRRAASYVAAA